MANVDFLVDEWTSGRQLSFDTFDDAAVKAVQEAMHSGKSHIDICVYDEEGAEAVGLSEAYKLDPNASVHERIEVSVSVKGTVP